VAALLEDAVFISPRLLVARSPASEAQWGKLVESIFEARHEEYVTKVRYGDSQGGGTIAIPPVLREAMAMRRVERRSSDGREMQVIIKFSGEFIEARLEEAGKLVQMVGAVAGFPFEAVGREAVHGKHQWAMIQDARYGWRGEILTQCGSEEEVLHLFQEVNGKTIGTAQGGKILVEVFPHASLILRARNAAGW